MVAAAAGAESEGWLNKFGSNLRSELGQVLGATEVPYYEAVVNVTYVSRSEFDMRAMGPLYNSTPAIINTIANKQAYPEGKQRPPTLLTYLFHSSSRNLLVLRSSLDVGVLL